MIDGDDTTARSEKRMLWHNPIGLLVLLESILVVDKIVLTFQKYDLHILVDLEHFRQQHSMRRKNKQMGKKVQSISLHLLVLNDT